jgi:hypothetical protein
MQLATEGKNRRDTGDPHSRNLAFTGKIYKKEKAFSSRVQQQDCRTPENFIFFCWLFVGYNDV